jgi:hypothetical protein
MSLTSDDLADVKQLMESVLSGHTAEINKRFDDVNKRLDGMDERFDDINERLDSIDKRLDENEEVQNEILNAIGTDLNRHSARLDDYEDRLKKLERGVA